MFASVFEESVNDEPLVINGLFVDLFDPNLPVVEKVKIFPGENGLWFDLNKLQSSASLQLIAAASRVESLKETKSGFSLFAIGPERVNAVARIRCLLIPAYVIITSGGISQAGEFEWDEKSRSVLIRYANSPGGVNISVE